MWTLRGKSDYHNKQLLHVTKRFMFTINLPETGGVSGSLVLCKTTVPESTVTNPHSAETMLLAL